MCKKMGKECQWDFQLRVELFTTEEASKPEKKSIYEQAMFCLSLELRKKYNVSEK